MNKKRDELEHITDDELLDLLYTSFLEKDKKRCKEMHPDLCAKTSFLLAICFVAFLVYNFLLFNFLGWI